MKYNIVLFIILFPAFSTAQTKVSIDSLAKMKLNDLMESWTLGIDSTTDVIDIKIYNKFKSLFDLDATVDDDFNAVYQNINNTSGYYKIDKKPKAFDDYAHDVALQIKSIVVDTVLLLNSNTTRRKNMTFTIKRSVSFQKIRKYVLPDNFSALVVKNRVIEDKKDASKMISNLDAEISKNPNSVYRFSLTDTLRITMALESDTIRITGIKSIKNLITEFRCTNDADLDAIPDDEDTLKNTFGDFTAKGTPDADLDRVPNDKDKCPRTYGEMSNQGCPLSYFITRNELEAFIGLQQHSAKINLPELNQLGYRDKSGKDAMDIAQSKKGILKNPGRISGVYAGGNFTYYFGKKMKKSGISGGFTYSALTAQYELTDPIVYTFKSFDGINFYRRQITINSLKEGINYTIFNVPVMFNYRLHLDRMNKSVINLKAGPSVMLFTSVSNYNARIDFGGLYQIDTILKNSITYYDHFNRGSTYNIFFTSNSINSTSANPGANNIFGQLASKSYDFADNKNYSGQQNLKRMVVAFNLNIDVQHKISEGLTIKAGVHFVYAPLPMKNVKYRPIDKTTDEYQSIYKSTAKSSYSAAGVNVGIVYNF